VDEVLLLGLDPASGEADEREVEHDVEHLLRRLPVLTDLVCTHTVGGAAGEALRTAASVRLLGIEGDALDQLGLLTLLAACGAARRCWRRQRRPVGGGRPVGLPVRRP
jgi:hypothetical protein